MLMCTGNLPSLLQLGYILCLYTAGYLIIFLSMPLVRPQVFAAVLNSVGIFSMNPSVYPFS